MKTYPKNCITLDEAIDLMRQIVGQDGLKVERFRIETISAEGNTLKLKWDRNNVGQPASVEAIR